MDSLTLSLGQDAADVEIINYLIWFPVPLHVFEGVQDLARTQFS